MDSTCSGAFAAGAGAPDEAATGAPDEAAGAPVGAGAAAGAQAAAIRSVHSASKRETEPARARGAGPCPNMLPPVDDRPRRQRISSLFSALIRYRFTAPLSAPGRGPAGPLAAPAAEPQPAAASTVCRGAPG